MPLSMIARHFEPESTQFKVDFSSLRDWYHSEPWLRGTLWLLLPPAMTVFRVPAGRRLGWLPAGNHPL